MLGITIKMLELTGNSRARLSLSIYCNNIVSLKENHLPTSAHNEGNRRELGLGGNILSSRSGDSEGCSQWLIEWTDEEWWQKKTNAGETVQQKSTIPSCNAIHVVKPLRNRAELPLLRKQHKIIFIAKCGKKQQMWLFRNRLASAQLNKNPYELSLIPIMPLERWLNILYSLPGRNVSYKTTVDKLSFENWNVYGYDILWCS